MRNPSENIVALGASPSPMTSISLSASEIITAAVVVGMLIP